MLSKQTSKIQNLNLKKKKSLPTKQNKLQFWTMIYFSKLETHKENSTNPHFGFDQTRPRTRTSLHTIPTKKKKKWRFEIVATRTLIERGREGGSLGHLPSRHRNSGIEFHPVPITFQQPEFPLPKGRKNQNQTQNQNPNPLFFFFFFWLGVITPIWKELRSWYDYTKGLGWATVADWLGSREGERERERGREREKMKNRCWNCRERKGVLSLLSTNKERNKNQPFTRHPLPNPSPSGLLFSPAFLPNPTPFSPTRPPPHFPTTRLLCFTSVVNILFIFCFFFPKFILFTNFSII